MALATLKTWVAGYSRSSRGNPYMMLETHRLTLFPGAPASSVVPLETSAAIQRDIAANEEVQETEQMLSNVDVGLVAMDDDTGERVQVGPSGDGSSFSFGDAITDTIALQGVSAGQPGLSEPSSAGGTGAVSAPMNLLTSVSPSKERRSRHHDPSKEREKKPSSSKSKKNSDKTQKGPSLPKAPSKDSSQNPLPDMKTPAWDMEAFCEKLRLSVQQSLQPQLTSMANSISTVSTSLGELRTTVQQNRAEDEAARKQHKEETAQQLASLASQMGTLKAGGQPDPMPPIDSLPDLDPSNPWRSARYAPLVGGMLSVEGFGTRPASDFERYPPEANFPFCYVRLNQEAAVREDKVPKETVLYSRDRAQTMLMKCMKDTGCVNTKVLPAYGNLAMFQTNPETSNLFATKVFGAVWEAALEDKSAPALREEEPTSWIFPNDSPVWEDVVSTFSVGKLAGDCASAQFNEEMPRLPEALLKTECEAKMRLARTLNTFTLNELMMNVYEEAEIFKVIVKGMTCSLRHDLVDFIKARRACRKHIFAHASVRHEPSKLINGPIWGATLFTQAIVQEVIAAATQGNQSLQTRLGLQLKRKFQPGTGPQPKNVARKRFRKGTSFTIPKVQQPPSFPSPGPSGHYQWVPAAPYQSPASNPAYEQKAKNFRAQSSLGQARGRGGAAVRGRSRFAPFRRGRGGSARGRGGKDTSNQ